MSCALMDFLQTLQPQHPVMHPGMRDAGTENISECMKSSRVNILTRTHDGRPDKIPNMVAPHGAPSLIGSGLYAWSV